MGRFPEDPLDLDLHNPIRETSGYHRIERICKLYQEIFILEHLCRRTRLLLQ